MCESTTTTGLDIVVVVVVVVVVVLHIQSRSDLYSVLSNIRTGPTDANAFQWSQANYPERVRTHIGKK